MQFILCVLSMTLLALSEDMYLKKLAMLKVQITCYLNKGFLHILLILFYLLIVVLNIIATFEKR